MEPKIKQINGKDYIFCNWRRKYVRLTPEEWVRQQFLHYLVEQLRYPSSLIAVEIAFSTGRRADAVVYSKQLVPLVIIEFKADSVALTQDTLDQAAAYNRQLQVPYLILHNGINTIVGKIVPAINTPSAENIPIQNHTIEFLDNIPSYSSLIS